MNAPHPLQSQLLTGQATPAEETEGINLLEYWDIVVDQRWLVASVFALSVVVGGTYAFLARPVFEANTLIQVEDNMGNNKSLLGEAAGLVDVKTATSAEMEILRSRLVIGQAVDSARLYIDARPRYLPVIGAALARRTHELSNPGFPGFPGYVTGAEAITVPAFDVPKGLEGSPFLLTAGANGSYVLTHPTLERPLQGRVGMPMQQTTAAGTLALLVTDMRAKPGAQFLLVRRSRQSAIASLQSGLRLV
jgi:tyrosine-protein kinase Etk/Wzc